MRNGSHQGGGPAGRTRAARAPLVLLVAGALMAGVLAPAIAGPEVAATAYNWHPLNAMFFQRNWGVDIVGVRTVASGAMLEFRYRVLDPAKARALNDSRSPPALIDRASGARLLVPSMDNVGALRQSAPPRAGRTYWIVFGNPGHRVVPGSRVDVEIGAFRAEQLVVN